MTDRPIWKSGLTLAAIAAVCTTMVAATWQLTHERIESNRKAWLEQSLQPALAGVFFEGSVTESKVTIAQPHDLPGSGAVIVYRVYAEGAPVAALFVVTARDGYAGPIRLLVGVSVDGQITGVRVLEHRETPGLGDQVEIGKSDWLLQFDGRSLGTPPADDWKIRGDGGAFDELTGASVTPRAIVKAVRSTLVWFEGHAVELFDMPADIEEDGE